MKKIYVFVVVVLLLCILILLIINKSKKSIVKIGDIKYFSFGYTTGTAYEANVLYEIVCKDDEYTVNIKPSGVSENDMFVKKIDLSFVKKIEDILNKYNVSRWNGFSKSDKNVLDGNSFSLSVIFQNDEKISASGYMMYPDNYGDVSGELDKLFMDIYNK